jgi:hypothetical protein
MLLQSGDAMKFCKDCKWLKIYSELKRNCYVGSVYSQEFCDKPTSFDLVTGQQKLQFAQNCRSQESLCGKDARWFEEGEPVLEYNTIETPEELKAREIERTQKYDEACGHLKKTWWQKLEEIL